MNSLESGRFRLTTIAKELLAALIVLTTCAMSATAAPVDFDGYTAIPLVCDELAEPAGDENPRGLDLVGTVDLPPAQVGFDSDFLYLRYRLNGDPTGPQGFQQYAWTALIQAPGENPFQYQYMVSVNGQGGTDDFGNSGDTIEVWSNTVATDIDFDPLFDDAADVRLFSQVYTYSGAGTANDGPLARVTVADTTYDDDPDYFLDFAVPLSALIAGGVITDVSEASALLFLPAVSTNANKYNKGRLDGCPFVPATDLSISKVVTPSAVAANTASPVSYTVTVQNTGLVPASGVVIEDATLPAFVTGVTVEGSASDPNLVVVLDSISPPRLKLPVLPVGATATMTISGTATATCADLPATNTASARATNAVMRYASADLVVDSSPGSEICDGADNDCDGQVDEGGTALCDDGNACSTDSCDAGVCNATPIDGCVPCAVDGDCNDGLACSADFCDAGVCNATPIDGCVPCAVDGDCNDGLACSADFCDAGVCNATPIDGCVPCAVDGDCNDGLACSADFCDAGVCNATPIDGCVPCAVDGDCNDGDACSADACSAGVCTATPIDGCVSCAVDGDCSDGNGCTIDMCGGDTCLPSEPIEGCVPCGTGADCDDQNPCTDDICTGEGVCDAAAIDGCIPCDLDADCADGDACTSDLCGSDGSCVVTTIPGCVPCDFDADCADGDECTTDACIAGACTGMPIEGCTICEPTPEVCGDGIDNDCDEATDCGDESCNAAPACQDPVEVCGDCIDNDADGFVDLDDPDCGCAQPDSLSLRRLKVKSKKTGGKKFKVKAVVADVIPVGFDPTATGMQMQMSDVDGVVFCARFDEGWERRGKRRIKYRNKDKTTERLAGLKVAKFKVTRSGRVKFVAKGPNADLRDDITGDVKVSVLVGNQCSVSSAALRTKKRKLVYP